MANPYQQQVFQRKLVYLGIVVGLLGASWFWKTYQVEPRARELQLLETAKGEADVLGSAARTSLSGLRGLATCALWREAIEQQKKNQWNSLERTVDKLTRLQPHLVTPWLFQSWNLAYNVSVESDRIGDKYYYVTKGVKLLARGERQNRHQPNLRRDIGFYMQHKICQSDETNVQRSLFQLSCIPPVERDPERFYADTDKREIRLDVLKEFCAAHPHLVRRLHTPPLPYDLRREYRKFRCATAREVVQFLEDNKNVPSLFVEKEQDKDGFLNRARLDDPLERFPVLPSRFERLSDGGFKARQMFDEEDLTAELFVEKPVPDEVDAFVVAKAWYGYSQECVPDPAPMPGDVLPPKDRTQRRPKHMSIIVFRTGPARAQTYVAERMQVEGWYDSEPFELTEWFKPASGRDVPVKIGEERPWSAVAWQKSLAAWEKFGRDNHLLKPASDLETLRARSKAFVDKFRPNDPDARMPDPSKFTAEDRDNFEANQFLVNYDQYRHFSNVEHFLRSSRVELETRTIRARKLIYQAEQKRVVATALGEALEKYEHPDSLLAWRRVLEDNPAYRADSTIQEWSFESELKYHRLYKRLNEDNLAPDLALLGTLSRALAAPALAADWTLAPLFSRPQLQPDLEVAGPLDLDERGVPFVTTPNKDAVLSRRGLRTSTPQQPAPPAQQR